MGRHSSRQTRRKRHGRHGKSRAGRPPWLYRAGLPALALGVAAVTGVSVSAVTAGRDSGNDRKPRANATPAATSPNSSAASAARQGQQVRAQSRGQRPLARHTVVRDASGELTVVDGEGEVLGTGGEVKRYTVEVEEGLPNDPPQFARAIARILGDQRGWVQGGDVSFQRVDGGPVDFRVTLASPETVNELCAPLDTDGRVSCRKGERVVINQARWELAVPHFDGDLLTYRRYVINHEVGHALGHGHEQCPGDGQRAPVMLQQTYTLDGCTKNGWPHLHG